MVDEALEPSQLVVELRARGGVAVGEVQAADGDAADVGLDVAAVGVVRIAGQAAPGLLRLLAPGEDGDAVPALLAVPDGLVAGLADRVDRELLVRRLQLLQAGDVRPRLASQRSSTGSRALTPLTL